MKRIIVGFIFIVTCFFIAADCYESDGFMSAKIYLYWDSLLSTYQKEITGGYLFIINHGDEFYYKMCNSEYQIDYFMKHKVYTVNKYGEWKIIDSGYTIDDLTIPGNGIFRVQVKGFYWKIWRWE